MCVRACVHACACVCTYACVCMCMHACMLCVRSRVCVCVCMSVHWVSVQRCMSSVGLYVYSIVYTKLLIPVTGFITQSG